MEFAQFLRVVADHRVKGHLLAFCARKDGDAEIYCRSCDWIRMEGDYCLVADCFDAVMTIQRYGVLAAVQSKKKRQVTI
jgi:hypothetical protein